MKLPPHTSVAPGRIDPIGRWQGLHEYESHTVPLGAMIVDTKYCELCGRNFLRKAQSKNRYCSKCRLTILAVKAHAAEKPTSKLIH